MKKIVYFLFPALLVLAPAATVRSTSCSTPQKQPKTGLKEKIRLRFTLRKVLATLLFFCLHLSASARSAVPAVPLMDAAGPVCDTFLLKDGSVLYGRIQSRTAVSFKIKRCDDTALVATVNKSFVKEIRYSIRPGVLYDTLVLRDGRVIATRILSGNAQKIVYWNAGNKWNTIPTKEVRELRSDKFRLREGKLERIGQLDPANWKWSPSLLSGVLSVMVTSVGGSLGAQYDLFLLRTPKFKIAVGAQAAYLTALNAEGTLINAGPKFFFGSKRYFFMASAQYFVFNKYRDKGLYLSVGVAYRSNRRLFIIPALDFYSSNGEVIGGASLGMGFNF